MSQGRPLAREGETERGSAADPATVLATLIQLEREIRNIHDSRSLAFQMVNSLHRLVPYNQSVFWTRGPDKRVKIHSVSGVSGFDRHSPYIRWLVGQITDLGSAHVDDTGKPVPVELTAPPVDQHATTSHKHHKFGLCYTFHDARHISPGGLLFMRDTPWTPGELFILSPLLETCQHAWLCSCRTSSGQASGLVRKLKQNTATLLTLAVMAALLFLPVTQSALAPAEIIPIAPVAVSAPLDGVIREFHVGPNEAVTQGQALFTFDDTALRNQRDIAERSLKVSEAEYHRTQQLAFSDSKHKAEINLLRTKIELRRTELNFTEELLQRSVVRAGQSGVAIFNDPNDWIGQQLATGQKVMELADPGRVQLQAWVPVDDAINLQAGAVVKLFLNIDPSAALPARLTETSYTPAVNVDGILGFPVKAEFEQVHSLPRLGLRGTAKIHGETVRLGYYLFRRPVSALRRLLGV
jgi:hypothetical protein